MRLFLFHYYSNRPNPVYQNLADSFRLRGHVVWLAEPEPDGSLTIKGGNGIEETIAGCPSGPAQRKGLPLLRSLSSRLDMCSFLGRVKRAIRERSPDVVQVNPTSMAWLLPVMMPRSIRFVLDIRQINEGVNDTLKSGIRERLYIQGMYLNGRYIYEKTCFCHEQAAIRIFGEDWRESGVVVPVGVDDGFMEFQRPISAMERRAAHSFVYIGTLNRLRNLETLLEAARILYETTDQFQLDLIGPDTSNGYYQKVIEKLGIQSAVSVKPAVGYDEVPEALSKYDVGIAYVPDRPTWHYQPAIKALEYRAFGLPIISTNVASHREIVEQNRNGLLCEDEPESIADAMHSLIEFPETFVDIRNNALTMREGRSWLSVADMYLSDVYEPLLRDAAHR